MCHKTSISADAVARMLPQFRRDQVAWQNRIESIRGFAVERFSPKPIAEWFLRELQKVIRVDG